MVTTTPPGPPDEPGALEQRTGRTADQINRLLDDARHLPVVWLVLHVCGDPALLERFYEPGHLMRTATARLITWQAEHDRWIITPPGGALLARWSEALALHWEEYRPETDEGQR